MGFWNRPAAWKAVLVIAGYLVYYLAVSQLIGLLFKDEIDADNVLADATSMFFALVLPIGLGAVGLLVFAGWQGWLARHLRPPAHRRQALDVDRPRAGGRRDRRPRG